MRKKLYTIFIILISIIIVNKVNAEESILTFDRLKSYEVNNIYNVTSYTDGYIFSSEQNNNTTIYSYNNNDILKSSKQLEDLVNVTVTKYNDNYLIAGINNNVLKLYLLDTNLQIKNQLKTNYIINNSSSINLYIYNNKSYIMLTEEGILSDNNLYEIDENLNIKEQTFSSLGSETIKNILKGDYYLIHFNSNTNLEEVTETFYNESTYLENKYILVGNNSNKEYDEVNGYNYQGVITILDKNGNILINEINNKYYSYNNIKIIKDKIIVLAYNGDYYLLTYDFNGKLISEEQVEKEESLDINNMYKVGNKIVLELSEAERTITEKSNLIFYSYNLNIYKEESLYGTLNVIESSLPYKKVEFEVIPNSGYEIENIIVKDTQGEIIKVSGQSFIMPDNDVTLSVIYKESITNPETIDYIIFIFPILLIASLIMINLYKKMSWLK